MPQIDDQGRMECDVRKNHDHQAPGECGKGDQQEKQEPQNTEPEKHQVREPEGEPTAPPVKGMVACR